ncbi:MAG: Nramp family divalent metal transporter [Gammaproteobacteria bacterium]|nr:Nramp family divalent metal transporter [Gammaproteobacteria bacterium]MBU1553427.1 Nramp family divalent metal transporter [Gammaproteobacteria bacterium]MBU2069759.1 Nramp family divalent metal transporter [Gammaproteobacteria bacterium]MBU2184624.1 Nramp family divalent metal transporter [Gammaproteobacteria bacterium]MBU2205710.1 Nramp family divalent metal transporter [Gammaproteobacteria bacterium]
MTTKTFRFGPATLVTAAFIGPGTVITASLAGANYGYALVWALLFSVFATMVLQEMAARLGIVTGRGLGENLRTLVNSPLLRWPLLLLVVAAIVVGNSAYQAGNISGAALGAEAIFTGVTFIQHWYSSTGIKFWPLILGLLAAAVLWFGRYKWIERCLIGLVLLMSLAFIATMILTRPDVLALVKGAFWPQIPAGAMLTVVALIGTTVVPYSLFLHAASAAQKWPQADIDTRSALAASRADIAVAIPLGGLISIAIVSTAAIAFFGSGQQLDNVSQLAQSLTPLFGTAATWSLAVGLMAAGLSSAITAPLAAAYALTGIMGKPLDLKQPLFRLTWLAIISIGVLLSSLGIRPLNVIWFAQVANGILLPLICICLLLAMNHKVLGAYKNNRRQNVLGALVLLVSLLLSGRSLALAFALL